MEGPSSDSRLVALERRVMAVARLSRRGELDGPGALSGPVLFQYPGRMAPSVQSAIFDAVLPALPDEATVLDPFVGSGITLDAARLRSLEFTGVDINPLAVLICAVKAGPLRVGEFVWRAVETGMVARSDRRLQPDCRFDGMEKWFREDVAIDLGRLRRAILKAGDESTRDFLWVCLAETVRRVSNSRVSTCKLHMRTLDDVRRPLAVIDEFEVVAERFAGRLGEYRRGLPDGADGPCRPVRLVCGDVRSVDQAVLPQRGFDLVITSPPYGDNHTTVPYGQTSYLPLRWIPASELARITNSRHPATAYQTDTASLGGSMKAPAGRAEPESEALAATLQHLSQCPADRAKRVQRFVADLDHCLERVVDASAPGAVQVWTVGDRHVGGRRVPLRKIFRELAASRRLEFVGSITRALPSQRRMAVRNQHAPRIATEDSLVFVAPPTR
ncbi:MAG: hypothetical protein OXG57_07885 [Acidimicrobiaceae bacterium]|nr:hypothetical protein [Acidimicrobiaceae bacterium]MCY3608349.1 hypothetical protein [Acidimicrobiaceae bacterium]